MPSSDPLFAEEYGPSTQGVFEGGAVRSQDLVHWQKFSSVLW